MKNKMVFVGLLEHIVCLRATGVRVVDGDADGLVVAEDLCGRSQKPAELWLVESTVKGLWLLILILHLLTQTCLELILVLVPDVVAVDTLGADEDNFSGFQTSE